jgi:hypothetical protein
MYIPFSSSDRKEKKPFSGGERARRYFGLVGFRLWIGKIFKKKTLALAAALSLKSCNAG